ENYNFRRHKKPSFFLLVFLWSMSTVLLTNHYKGEIASLLTFPLEPEQPRDLQSLASSSLQLQFSKRSSILEKLLLTYEQKITSAAIPFILGGVIGLKDRLTLSAVAYHSCFYSGHKRMTPDEVQSFPSKGQRNIFNIVKSRCPSDPSKLRL